MPLYEFECPDGHVTSKIVPIGTETVRCEECFASLHKEVEQDGFAARNHACEAKRVLSATRTTFRHNDRTSKL